MPRNAPTQTVELRINDTTHVAPVQILADEDGALLRVLMFTNFVNIMEAWETADPTHRKYGWASQGDAGEPEPAFIVWVATDGTLRTEFASPFYDGVDTINGYAVDELKGIAGISLAGDHPLYSEGDKLIREAMDENGYMVARTDMSQDAYLDAHAAGELDETVHAQIFRFGLPYDSSVLVTSVNDDGSFRVEYTTKISEFLMED